MGCGVFSPCNDQKLKRDENLVGLNWTSKVFYVKGLKDV
jgi:hypothetical protein